MGRVDLTMGIISHVSQDNMTTVTDPTQLSWELCQAVMANDQALVEKLQAAGHKLTGTYSGGNTIIHWALGVRSKCDTDLLEYLWRCGANGRGESLRSHSSQDCNQEREAGTG